MAWGVRGYRGLVHRAALADRAGAGGRARRRRAAIHNRSREEPVDVTVDGRPVCVLAPAEQLEARFVDDQGRAGPDPGHDLLPAPAPEVRPPGDAALSQSATWTFTGIRPVIRPGPDPSAVAGRPSRMLDELRVENLLLMERAELRLAPGLNVLTGETGAGKTLLAHALDLLLGGRARRGIVRAGADGGLRRGRVRAARRVAGRRRAAAGRRRGARRSRGASGPTGARAPTSAAGRRRSPICASSAASCSRSTGSTSTAS